MSGLDETRHVFLAGNALGERWTALAPFAQFVIGETGFGTGLNFVCAWQLWERAAPPTARLHFVSVERYPLAAPDIARALALWPELAPHVAALLGQWTDLLPGWHRFAFADGRVHLTIIVADIRAALPRIHATVDAWFLDGFAPAKNPDMWHPGVLVDVARLSRAGTTCATYTVAGDVRRGLEAAGFEVEKRPGFGTKREMLRGTLRVASNAAWRAPWFGRPHPRVGERRAIVVGGGLAGSITAASLATRGWTIDLIERRSNIAAEASGNSQSNLHARLSPYPNALGDLAAAGLQYTARLINRLALEAGEDVDACGVLQLAHDEAEAKRHERLQWLALPPSVVKRVDREEAAAIAGVDVPSGGLFLAQAGWIDAGMLCRTIIRRSGVNVVVGRDVLQLRRLLAGWEVVDDLGPIATAPVLIIAAAGHSSAFDAARHLPLRLIRGQLTLVPATPASRALQTILCGDGHIAPARGGFHRVGATHKFRDTSTTVTTTEHVENLARLGSLSPACYTALGGDRIDPAQLAGWAALRCSTPDYLPVIGPLVDAAQFTASYAPLARDATLHLDTPSPWLDGLYVNTAHGSRGLITAPLAGEIIAAYLEDEPAPLPRSVMEAVHPSRFLLRALIRRQPQAELRPAT
jgi:tRNA 5-methylaminomethyl-2-thiouridine biosynthesis bifunctional protein